MRIALITTLNSHFIDGVTNVVMNLGEQLYNLGNQVDIISVDAANDFPRYEVVNAIAIRRFKSTVFFKRVIPHWEFVSFLNKNLRNYDVVHIHGFSALSSIIACYTLRTLDGKSKAVFTPHYHKTSWNIFNLLGVLYDIAWCRCLKYFDQIIFVSIAEKTVFFDRFGVQEKSKVIYNGVNLELIQEAKPYESNDKLVIYVGGLRKYKNIVNLIRAFQYLPAEYKLAIIGSGPQQNELEEIIRQLGFTARVVILTNITNAELYRWYKTGQLVVNLSTKEAFGIVLLEALAAGKRVVCSDIPSFKELAIEFDGIHPISEFGTNSERLANTMQQIAMMLPPDNKTSIQQVTWNNIGQAVNNSYCELMEKNNDRKR